jgi:glyoxylase-like metal-dependent hydrolase (beta-lactamase superfamily II)
VSDSAAGFRPPTVHPERAEQVADGVWVIPDSEYTQWVPNIGIVVGADATLVIDTGLGIVNSRSVLEKARELSGNRRLLVTLTHFHPEHGYGVSQVFDEVATIFYNKAQWVELQEKGDGYSALFTNDAPDVVPKLLEGVVFEPPHLTYTGSVEVDLGGGVTVECREFGGGHSRGDQAILVHADKKVLFTGDLVEEKYFGVLPDEDAHVKPWINALLGLEALRADIVVPGHGLTGGNELTVLYREYFEFAVRRVQELRGADELSDEAIVGVVTQELLDLHPDWYNGDWAKVAVSDLRWPARP